MRSRFPELRLVWKVLSNYGQEIVNADLKLLVTVLLFEGFPISLAMKLFLFFSPVEKFYFCGVMAGTRHLSKAPCWEFLYLYCYVLFCSVVRALLVKPLCI